MPDLLVDPPPDEYSRDWMERTLRRLERAIPPTVVHIGPQRVELNADTGVIPLWRAPWPGAVKRVEIWSPVDVPSSPGLYTILNVRNKETNVSLLLAEGGFSTSGGLNQWEWHVVAGLDDEIEMSGPDMSFDRGQTLILDYEHYDSGTAVSTVPLGSEYEEAGEQAMPEETGGLVVELWVRVEVERS